MTIPAGREVTSEPAALAVAPDANVTASFPGPATATQHETARQVNYAAPGNQNAATTLSNRQPSFSHVFLPGLDVHNPQVTWAVVDALRILSDRTVNDTDGLYLDSGPATTVNLNVSGPRQAQQAVFTATGLNPTQRHRMTIVSTAVVPQTGMIDAVRVVSR